MKHQSVSRPVDELASWVNVERKSEEKQTSFKKVDSNWFPYGSNLIEMPEFVFFLAPFSMAMKLIKNSGTLKTRSINIHYSLFFGKNIILDCVNLYCIFIYFQKQFIGSWGNSNLKKHLDCCICNHLQFQYICYGSIFDNFHKKLKFLRVPHEGRNRYKANIWQILGLVLEWKSPRHIDGQFLVPDHKFFPTQ